MVEEFQKKCFDQYGLHFIHASDEWYMIAGMEFPKEERYDGYIQLENGVGMMRLFIQEFNEAYSALCQKEKQGQEKEKMNRTLTIATGKLAYPTVQTFASRLMDHFPGLTIHVYPIRNDFFGETITVSGLITGQDLIKQLKDQQDSGVNLGETLLIPSNMLRSGEAVFLDDVTGREVEEALGLRVKAVEPGGGDFIQAVLDPEYAMSRNNENVVYIKAYENT